VQFFIIAIIWVDLAVGVVALLDGEQILEHKLKEWVDWGIDIASEAVEVWLQKENEQAAAEEVVLLF
jgi:hypothetical protein